MTVNSIKRINDDRIDELELVIENNLAPVNCPLRHMFSKGMYIREITIPTGTLLTSKIHKTEHPFTISKGSVLVSVDGGQWDEFNAPYTGITKPGTRRVIYIISECVWTTYHRYRTLRGDENELTDEEKIKIAEKIEGRIIEKHYNALIDRRENICHSLQ